MMMTAMLLILGVSCDDNEKDSPYNWEIEGEWLVTGYEVDNYIIVFNKDGSGYCRARFDDNAAPVPFRYKLDMPSDLEGTLTITSTANPEDYAWGSQSILAFHPGTYEVSPTTRTLFVIKGKMEGGIEHTLVFHEYQEFVKPYGK